MFLTPEEVAELTGVRIGRNGKTREQLQIAQLKAMRIPHYVNAIDRPIVVRAILEGGSDKQSKPPAPGWEPGLMKGMG
ncbi:DUF4224 domain-containing protein [Acidovorax sp. ACV01]|uniref:DUF4224 domain-containing protein n=1 Tax=Acidovorax sp. ACV01 TaxID=2769311 RepID=UPI001CE1BE7A|nr:DUF4224 domain-containing protein [Acidovorax sp. ACV01]